MLSFSFKNVVFYIQVLVNLICVRDFGKTSSSDTATTRERFWQEQCAWWKDNSTIGGQISEDRKCGRC